VAPYACRYGLLVRSATLGVHDRCSAPQPAWLWSRAPRDGAGLPGEIRSRVLSLCLDLSAAAAAEAAGLFRRAASGPDARDLHDTRAGRRVPRAGRVMPQFRTKRRVRHAASDMFDLVAAM